MTGAVLEALALAFRVVIRLYPSAFRERLLSDMVGTFREECRARAERSVIPLLGYGIPTVVGALWGALSERARSWRHSHRDAPEGHGDGWAAPLLQDVKYAARGLRLAPGFTGAAVLTMALAIGATTAVYTMVDRVVLRSLPYPEADRLVRLAQQNSATNRWNLSVVDFQAIAEQQASFERVAAFRPGEATLTGRGDPVRVRAGWVDAEWFATLGVRAAVGRVFGPADAASAAGVVVVDAALAERYFGSAREGLGESLILDGESYEVVGVLPRGIGALAGWRAEVWPLLELAEPTRRGPFFLKPVARLRAGTTMEAAAADLRGISERIFPLWAAGFKDSTARLTPVPLKEAVIGDVDRTLVLLLGAVGFVLLIAVANVASLLVGRASSREHEVAIRTALGARRGRLARQLMVESLLLAVGGGVVGIGLARMLLAAFVRFGPYLPRLNEVALDLRIFGVAAAVTLGSGLIFGAAPLVHALAAEPAHALRRRGRGTGRGVGGTRVRAALVVAEFALAVPLLAGALLLMTSLTRLQRVDAGFLIDGLTVGRVSLTGGGYQDPAARTRFWDRALRAFEEAPGVARVAITSGLPPDAPWDVNNFDLIDRPVAEGTTQPMSPWLAVSPGFFETLGVPLLAGRALEAADSSGDPVVVVSKSWADRYYPGETPVGRRLYEGGCYTCTPTTVVGVVGDVPFEGLGATEPQAVYSPYAQRPWPGMFLVVRGVGGSTPTDAVRRTLSRLDPALPLAQPATMSARIETSIARPRYWSWLLGGFAVVGMLLACVGVYGVLATYVARQRRDIGIRVALGADRMAVVVMVVRRGMGQAVLGLALGLGAALVLTRSLAGLLFEVSPADPVTFATVAVLLGAVALVACLGPARRATAVDPVRVLSEE